MHTVSPPIQLCQNILKSVVAEGHEATRRLSQSLCPDSPDSWPLPPRGAKSCLVLPAGGRPGPLRRGPPGCSGGVTAGAGHRRSFAGHRLRSANPLPAAGDGPGHRSQVLKSCLNCFDDARARRRAAPTARHGAVPPPRVDGSRGRTARSPRLGTAAASVLDPAAARGRPVTPPGDTAPAPSSARALSREPLSGQAPTRGALGRCPAGAFLPANTDLFQRV